MLPKRLAKASAMLLLGLSLAGAGDWGISRTLQGKIRKNEAAVLRFSQELNKRQGLPVVSTNPSVDKESLKLSYFHSDDGAYKDWVRAKARALGAKPMEVHAAVMQTVRNIQTVSGEYAGKPGQRYPFTFFTANNRVHEHAILMAKLIARTGGTGLYTPLEALFKEEPAEWKATLRPGHYAPFFKGKQWFPNPAFTVGVVNTIDAKVITDTFDEILSTGRTDKRGMEFVAHEAAHVFDGERSHDEINRLGYAVQEEVLANPKRFRSVFGPLLELAKAGKMRGQTRQYHPKSRPPNTERAANRPKITEYRPQRR